MLLQRIFFLYLGLCVFSLYRLSLLQSSSLGQRVDVSFRRRKTIDTHLNEAWFSLLAWKASFSDEIGSLVIPRRFKNPVNVLSHQRLRPVMNKKTTNDDANIISFPSSLSSEYWPPEPFPRWSGGIAVAFLVKGIRISLAGLLKADRVHVVYVIDSKARLWKSVVPRGKGADEAPLQRGELMETLAVSVLQNIFNITATGDPDNYPHLKTAVRRGGLAYIANYADSKFCCDKSLFKGTDGRRLVRGTVPIFTLSAPVDCNYSFPVPTYKTIQQAKKPWPKRVDEYHKVYPWSEKKRSAVWRGAPTGDRHAETNTRVQLCELAVKRPDLVDAKLTGKRRSGFADGFNESQYIGTKIPMPDFQKYRAILDTDGHSWSSRFGELLCYSSVVVKVQPANVDYFHTQLQPWVHYIPVKSDLSDLYDMVELAVSDDARIQQIIQHANRWCVDHLNTETLTRDMARIWDTYAAQLYHADPSWGKSWQAEVKKLLKDFNFTLIR